MRKVQYCKKINGFTFEQITEHNIITTIYLRASVMSQPLFLLGARL